MIGRGEGSLSRAGVKKSKSESKNLNIDCQEILISNSASIFNLFSLTTVPKYWCTLFIAKVSHEGITSFRSSTCIMSWNVNTPKYCSPQKLLFWQLGKRRMSMFCRQKREIIDQEFWKNAWWRHFASFHFVECTDDCLVFGLWTLYFCKYRCLHCVFWWGKRK